LAVDRTLQMTPQRWYQPAPCPSSSPPQVNGLEPRWHPARTRTQGIGRRIGAPWKWRRKEAPCLPWHKAPLCGILSFADGPHQRVSQATWSTGVRWMAAGEKPGVSPGFLLEESPDSAARWLPVPVAGGRKLAPAARRGGAIRRMRTGPSPVP